MKSLQIANFYSFLGVKMGNVVTVSAILLAAGEAKRIGKPKLLMPFGGSTVLERTLDNLLTSRVGEVIVVLGPRAGVIKQVIANRKVKVVANPDYHLGMSTSLITGLSLVDDKAQRIMIALADQPLIYSEIYDILIEASLSYDRGIIIPIYQGRRGNPIIFSAKYKQELFKLKGDVGGRQIVRRHPDDILEVAVNSEGINLDIDNMYDYFRLLSYKVEE
jgi:molybdenum cofactor cytidylyltransferase